MFIIEHEGIVTIDEQCCVYQSVPLST